MTDSNAHIKQTEQIQSPDSASSIIELREIVEKNFERTIAVLTQLEANARQNRTDSIEACVVTVISSLILIFYASDVIEMSDVSAIEDNLIKIQNLNCLGEDFFLQIDEWQSLYQKAVPQAILKASSALQSKEFSVDILYVDELMETIDFDLLRRETLKILRLTYAFNPIDTYLYLRSLWLDRLIDADLS